jgi:hypothetical protein
MVRAAQQRVSATTCHMRIINVYCLLCKEIHPKTQKEVKWHKGTILSFNFLSVLLFMLFVGIPQRHYWRAARRAGK